LAADAIDLTAGSSKDPAMGMGSPQKVNPVVSNAGKSSAPTLGTGSGSGSDTESGTGTSTVSGQLGKESGPYKKKQSSVEGGVIDLTTESSKDAATGTGTPQIDNTAAGLKTTEDKSGMQHREMVI
jgi:hypothetical protein